MKKVLIILSLLMLVGCGKFKYESKSAKEKFLTKMVKENDSKLYKEYQEILLDLQSKMGEDEEASKQLKEWGEVQVELIQKQLNLK